MKIESSMVVCAVLTLAFGTGCGDDEPDIVREHSDTVEAAYGEPRVEATPSGTESKTGGTFTGPISRFSQTGSGSRAAGGGDGIGRTTR